MSHLFRQFIENNLFNFHKNVFFHSQEITPQKLCLKLNKLIQKNLFPSSNNGLSISKIGANKQKDHKIVQQKQESIEKNEIYLSSLEEISTFVFKLSYSHPGVVLYPKYNIDNIIGFYQISKLICHSQAIFHTNQLRNNFNHQVVTLLFTQKILVYKDIYYRIEESSVFKNFIEEFFLLIGRRIEMMMNKFGVKICKNLVETCKSHVRSFIQRYQMTESMRHFSRHQMLTSHMHQSTNNRFLSQNLIQSQTITNQSSTVQSQQLLNIISIDEIITCFIYLLYRSSRQNSKIAMWKLTQSYFKEILQWERYKKDGRLVELFNNCYLKLYLSGKLEIIEKSHVAFCQTRSKLFLADIVENQDTVLDYFASSLEN